MFRKILAFLFFSLILLKAHAFAGEVGSFLSLEGYTLEAPVLTEDSSLVSFQRWTIKVYPEKKIRLKKLLVEGPAESLEQRAEFYKGLHLSAGQAVKIFLEQNSIQELIPKLKALTRMESLSAGDLRGDVHVHFFDDGSEKIAYIFGFGQKIKTDRPPWVVLKFPKKMDPAKLEETLAAQKKLNQAFPELAPSLGDVIKTQSFTAYLEEYVQGRSIASLMKADQFNQEMLRQTIRGMIQMYKTLGFVAVNPRPDNILLSHNGSPDERLFVSDLETPGLVQPHQILKKLDAYYRKESRSSWGIFKKKKADSSEIIFSEILFTLGEKDGHRFLQRASNNLSEKVKEMQDPASERKIDPQVLRLAEDLNLFLNRTQPVQ